MKKVTIEEVRDMIRTKVEGRGVSLRQYAKEFAEEKELNAESVYKALTGSSTSLKIVAEAAKELKIGALVIKKVVHLYLP